MITSGSRARHVKRSASSISDRPANAGGSPLVAAGGQLRGSHERDLRPDQRPVAA